MANGQDVKPRITGQKELSTEQSKPITITLSDLYVEETPGTTNGGGSDGPDDDGSDNDGSNGNGGQDQDDDDDNAGEDNENNPNDDEETDGGDGTNGGADDGKDDQGDDDDEGKDDHDGKGKGDKADKGDKGNKGDKGSKDEKDDQGDKNDKGNKDNKGDGDKGKGKNSTGRTTYPQGYSLELLAGKNYTFTGTTVTPDADFTGTLSVQVRVKNATHTSPKYDLKITVKPVAPPPNKLPVITGQGSLSTSMDTPISIKFSDLQVSDADDTYPEGFAIALQPGENYTVDQLTITPASGFTGRLVVPATVSDGKDSSSPFNLKVTVQKTSTPNIRPVITGQLPLNISMNQAVEIVLSQLTVHDPDNKYPDDFTLRLFTGANYTVEGATVRPHANFTGDLSVGLAVNDGSSESIAYPLKISVTQTTNTPPVITAQRGLKVPQGQSLEIKLTHLLVEDPDNAYPDDFTLSVQPGTHYNLSHNTITPLSDFLGMLTVPVAVHDGNISSALFDLKVQVIPIGDLEIVGQKAIETAEDSPFSISLTDLKVNDPSNTFPQGFSLHVMPGENYDLNMNQVKPHHDFTGNLMIPVTVAKGNMTSPAFSMLLSVNPVNDPPALLNPTTDPVRVSTHGSWPLFGDAEINDVDDDDLVFAEIGFRPASFQSGIDKLLHEGNDNIHAVFDDATGVLFMVGKASLTEYQNLIRSVSYSFEGSSDSVSAQPKAIYLKLNDGKNTSVDYEKMLTFDSNASLEIPSAFTPNNDNANDTWKITSSLSAEQLKTFVRVYDKNGNMVFESSELAREWDGHYNGSPLPADVYFYTIDMDLSNRRVSYKGIVAILR